MSLAPEEIRRAPIRRLRAAIDEGETDGEAVCRAFLERIEAREPAVKAWAHLNAGAALAGARDAGRRGGALGSIPVGVKDSIDTADMPTAHGSGVYAGNRPRADASCVAILRAAGAIVLGKTAMTEFAAPFPGPTRNPKGLDHTPGGSSSGSAAAVADDMAPAALASQTMGSLIRPAAYCGIVGLKPSYGLLNMTGIKPQAPSFDTLGVIARTVDDAVLVLETLAMQPAGRWAERRAARPRIGVFRGPDIGLAEGPAVAALDRAASLLADAGARVSEVRPPPALSAAYDAQIRLLCYEMARSMAWEWHACRERISALLQGWIEAGRRVSLDEHLADQESAEAARRSMAGAFGEVDAWLTFSAPGEAPRGLSQTGDTGFNRLWTLLHLPAVTLPAGLGPAGMPLGVQLVGGFREDARLIGVARWVEEALAGAGAPAARVH